MGSAPLSPRESFRHAVAVPPSQIDLVAVSLYIAAEEYPDLDIVQTRGRVALLAEKLDHHPDWSNSWNTVVMDIVNHSAGGVTKRCIDLALAVPDGAEGYVMGDIARGRQGSWRTPSGIEASLTGFSLHHLLGRGPEPPLAFQLTVSPGSLEPRKLVGSLVARVPRDRIRGHRVGPANVALRIVLKHS